MGVNKVEYGGNTLIDLTEDTVTEDTLAEGTTAHNAAGEQITGKMVTSPTGNYIPVPATAEVGQTLRVSEVDENGKPTAWEAVDFPSGGGGIPVPWLQDFELMGTATLTEECQRWIVTQTDDGVTFEEKRYNQIRLEWLGKAGTASTAQSAQMFFWINHPAGNNNLYTKNSHHAGGNRKNCIYAAINETGKRYMKQIDPDNVGNEIEWLSDDAWKLPYIKQLVFDTNSATNLFGINTTVTIYGKA